MYLTDGAGKKTDRPSMFMWRFRLKSLFCNLQTVTCAYYKSAVDDATREVLGER